MSELMDLKLRMVKNGIKQREVAKAIDVSEGYLSDIMTGYKPVDSDLRKKIVAALEQLIQNKGG